MEYRYKDKLSGLISDISYISNRIDDALSGLEYVQELFDELIKSANLQDDYVLVDYLYRLRNRYEDFESTNQGLNWIEQALIDYLEER